MEILNSPAILNSPVTIKCTWANCYTEPEIDRGLCIRSYDRNILAKKGVTDGVIATLTGNYCINEKEVVFLEANLKFSNRRAIGWFRESDINHSKATPGEEPENPQKKSFNWLAWVTGGITLLNMMKG